MGNDNSNDDRVYKLDDRSVESIAKLDVEFKRIFRRPSQAGDLLFFPSVLFSEEDIQDQFADFMEQANIPAELQYATLKTKRFVTHENYKNLDDEEIAEWNDAIAEFRRASQHGWPKTGKEDFEHAVDRLMDEFARLPLVFAYYLDRTSHVGESRECGLSELASFLCATKTLKTLKAALTLLDNHFGEDSVVLARTIFENYLQLVFALVEPAMYEQWVESRIGVKTGTHKYHVRPNGKVDYKQIVEIKSGKRLVVTSIHQMAKMSPFKEDVGLYSELYGMMSEYVHSVPTVLLNYWQDGWLTSTNRTMSNTAGLLCHKLTFLVLDALIQLDRTPTIFRRDVHVLLGFARRKIKTCFRFSTQGRSLTLLEDVLRQRMSRLGRPWIHKS